MSPTAEPDERFEPRAKREILFGIMKKQKLPSIFHAEDVLKDMPDDTALGFLPKEFNK